jgi:glycosyltransferase involved in cell wall biosynthesis
VVISISEVDQIEPSIIKSLKETQWHFSLKLILSKKKLFAGQNRNIACKNATSEIFICQDADDLPHPQRIEVIKYFFEKLNLDFLLHKYVYNSSGQIKQMKMIEQMDTLKYAYVKTNHEIWIVGYMLFGQPAFHRRVFQKIQWLDIPIAEDTDFDARVMNNFKNCIMVHCPLYIYRNELSATPYELYRSYGTKRSVSTMNQQNSNLEPRFTFAI